MAELAEDWIVLAEVGSKVDAVNRSLAGRDWARQVRTDLAHGARWVVLEARESGTAGIVTSDGSARTDVLDALDAAGIDAADVVFEAPNKALQSSLIGRYGADVNLGNVAAADLVAVETLRLGLRADTMPERAPERMPERLSGAEESQAVRGA